jgi:mannose-6-phosphate isomerase-like protein (cupin superfamily)
VSLEILVEDRVVTPKVWGIEDTIINTDKYCGKIMFLREGFQCSLHYHEQKDETFMAIAGQIAVEYYIGGHTRFDTVLQGWRRDALHLPPRTPHRFRAFDGDAVMVEFSTPHSDDDVVRIAPSGPVPVPVDADDGDSSDE